MIVGVDLDNTIISYNQLFYSLAVENNWVPAELESNRASVKKYLQDRNQNDVWTELQGLVYGPNLERAEIFPGVVDFFRKCKDKGIEPRIISHKTKHSASSHRFKLQDYARIWIEARLSSGENACIDMQNVFFAETRQLKVDQIIAQDCDVFVDDLIEVYEESHFPEHCQRILYDPDRNCESAPKAIALTHDWESASDLIFKLHD